MSFFKDDKDKDNFFSPVSFNSGSDTTSSWAFDAGNKKSENSFFSTSKGGSDAFLNVSSSAANDSKSSNTNFFSTNNNDKSSNAKDSAFGSMGYNSHSKDQDVFSLKQQLDDDSRFGHFTPQDKYITAEVTKSNLEDKDWSNRYSSNWAFEKTEDKSNWAFSTPSDSSSNWAFNQPSLNRWGFDSGGKDTGCDDFNPFSKKKD